jgi:signal transduction histidine kinase/pSer/pThr/pTyr-binding forkhead associated (FHA) protein
VSSLFVIRGNDQGTRYELDEDIVSLGRESTNRIQLHDQEVSRHHAELRREGGRDFRLVDLKSSNGTFVNERRVQEHALASGDRVQIGGTLLLFTGAQDESAGDLSHRVQIVPEADDADNSRIVHSVSQEEGSKLFRVGDGSGDSPWLARARSNLQVMYRTALAVSHTLDIDQLLTRILQLIFEWVEADHGCIMLVEPQTRKLEPKAYLSRKGARPGEPINVSQTILSYVLEHNEGVLTSNARDDRRWNPAASILQLGIREAICVPMQGRYDVVGIVHIDTSISPQKVIQMGGSVNKFTEEHLKLMVAIGHQAALAIEDTRYYSALVQAERLAAVGQTIAMLSHDIKNILQRLRGGSFLIKDGLAREDERMITKGWELVEKGQQRISNLVMDMLTFSKEREPELVPADLNEMVAEVVELSRHQAGERGVELVWEPAADLPQLTFDPEGLHRAVLNVLGNAIEACEGCETPRVRVRTDYDAAAGQARIHVEDNGVGIPPEDLDKIFTLFVSRKGSRGTGLGLPVSQKILTEHGGRIHVASEVGQGSRFVLEFPAVVPAPAAVPTGDTGQLPAGA